MKTMHDGRAVIISWIVVLATGCSSAPSLERIRFQVQDIGRSAERKIAAFHKSLGEYQEIRHRSHALLQQQASLTIELNTLADRSDALQAAIITRESHLSLIWAPPPGLNSTPGGEPSFIYHRADELYHSGSYDMAMRCFFEFWRRGDTSYDHDIIALLRIATMSKRQNDVPRLTWAVIELCTHSVYERVSGPLRAELESLESSLPFDTKNRVLKQQEEIDQMKREKLVVLERHQITHGQEYEPIQKLLIKENLAAEAALERINELHSELDMLARDVVNLHRSAGPQRVTSLSESGDEHRALLLDLEILEARIRESRIMQTH